MKYPKLLLPFFIVLALLCGSLFIYQKSTAATEMSDWFKSKSPEFKVSKINIQVSDIPTTYGNRGNIDCDSLEFTKRDGDPIAFSPLHRESQTTGCYTTTGVGLVDSQGYVTVSGTNHVAEVVKPDGRPTSFLGLPNTDVYISSASSHPTGLYVSFSHLSGSLVLNTTPTGKIQATINPAYEKPLLDRSGALLPIMADNMGISENGQWLVADSPGRGILRVNLDTMEVVPFTNSMEIGGIGSQLRYAITSDGRYIAVASRNFNYFKIFDLNTCAAVPDIIFHPVSCQSRDLQDFMQAKIPDFSAILQMRFMTDYSLRIFASYGDTSTEQYGEYFVAAPDTPLAGIDYLALGDSFTSGEGAHKYEIGTDDSEANMCHLSQVSYPYIVSNTLRHNSFHSVACSGAKTFNIVGGSGIDKNISKYDRDNQYKDKPLMTALYDWLPGYKKQISFVTENQPQLVTVSAIGNDLGFDEIIKACVKPGTCYPDYEDRIELFTAVDKKLTTVVKMLKKVKTAAPKAGRVYANGYPQLAHSSGNCGLNVHLNESELTLAGMFISRINEIVKTASAQAGVNYADVENALNGARLCESNAGNIAVNGVTAGKDILGILGNESYHPNEYGQFLMAQAILGSTNNLGMNNPNSNVTTPLPPINLKSPTFKVEKSGRAPKALKSLDTKNVAVNKGKLNTTLNGLRYGLKPNTSYSVKINGTQVNTATSDSRGDVSIEADLPSPGNHHVSIIGPDVTGETIDVSGNVGNTPPSSENPCGSIDASLVDADQDGIDDACDAFIGSPPQSPAAVQSSANIITNPPNDTPNVQATLSTAPIQTSDQNKPKTSSQITAGSTTASIQSEANTVPAPTEVLKAYTLTSAPISTIDSKIVEKLENYPWVKYVIKEIIALKELYLGFIALLVCLLLVRHNKHDEQPTQYIFVDTTKHSLTI